MKKDLQFIYFDLGNVLFNVDHETAWNKTKAYSPLPLETLYERFYASGDMIEHMIGSISDETFFTRLKCLVEFGGDVHLLQSIWESVFKPIPERLEVVKKLSKEIPVGIISNISSVHSNWLIDEVPEMQRFTHHVFSWETGFVKPRPEIFKIATTKCNISPSKCLFIDDQEQHVRAAKTLGWNAIQLNIEENLEKRLSHFFSIE